MKKFVSGFLALAWLAIAPPALAQSGPGYVDYKPGLVKETVAKKQTAILFYKSTW